MREMKDSGIEWIGCIPANWTTRRIKHNYNIISGATPKSEVSEYWDGEITWITPADFKTADYYVSIGKRNISSIGLASCSTSLIPIGSIIFSKRAPIGTVALNSVELCTNQGCLSCVNKHDETYNPYFYYVMSIGTEQFELLGSGTTFKEISASVFSNIKLPFPDVNEQKRISNFLDTKCAEINNLVADIQSQIDTLEQYKRSVITEAVTKGLNPDVEMKDSRIDDIGAIPKHWELRKIKYLFSLSSSKNYLPLEEVQLLSLYTDLGVFPHGEQEERGNKAVTADGYMIVHKNDIVVNIILAWMGAIGMSNYDGVTSPAYDIYRPNLDVVHPEFYHFLFRTNWFSGECYKYGRGIMAMRWRTYSSEFKNIPVPYPPLSEQKTIVDYLHNKCVEIERIIAYKRQQLATLDEYKKSLIYEYVTGKKEVIS